MQHVGRRLLALERLLQLEIPPNRLDQIERLALESLCTQDLELLWVIAREQTADLPFRDLCECEAVAYAVWGGRLRRRRSEWDSSPWLRLNESLETGCGRPSLAVTDRIVERGDGEQLR